MANCGWLWSIIWFIILIIFGWPIGILCAVFFVLFSPFSACCNGCTELIQLLDRGLKLPLTCAQNMVAGKSMCWNGVFGCMHIVFFASLEISHHPHFMLLIRLIRLSEHIQFLFVSPQPTSFCTLGFLRGYVQFISTILVFNLDFLG